MTITKEIIYYVVSMDSKNHKLTSARIANVYRNKKGEETVRHLGGKTEVLRAAAGFAVVHINFRSVKQSSFWTVINKPKP